MAKRGRPKSAYVALNVRMKEPTRARIERAAEGNGVSMNSEAVRRLEQSFYLDERLGGLHLAELIEAIAVVMRSTGESAAFFESGKMPREGEWMASPYAFDQAMKAAVNLMEHHRPPGEIKVPVQEVLEQIKQRWPDANPRGGPRMHKMLEQLGEVKAEDYRHKMEGAKSG